MGILTILWEKWVEFRRDFYKITLAAMIAPLMYLIVFGMGIQTSSHGEPYLNFLIPGVVSLTTMNGSFNAIAQNLNVQRLYEKAFDQVMISPTPLWQFIAGQIIGAVSAGLCRRNHPSSDHADRNRSCVQRMVIAGDVPQRCCIFSHRCCGFFPCQKPCGCTSFFQLYHYANGFFVQHLLLYREDPGLSWEFCSCSSTVTDQSSDPYHASGGGVNYLSVLILTVYLIAFSIAASWFIYKKKNL